MLLNIGSEQHATKQLVNEEINKYLKTNENRKIGFPNLQNTPKAVLKGKFIVIQILGNTISQETGKKFN